MWLSVDSMLPVAQFWLVTHITIHLQLRIFSCFLEMREFLLRTEMYEKFIEQDRESDMLRSLEYANIASRYNKEDVIKKYLSFDV